MPNSGPDRPLSPHLQIYRPMYTMVLSILHRASGLYLTAASLLLVAWLVAAGLGSRDYEAMLRLISSAPVRLLLAAAVAAFWYHCFAGLRHLSWDAGLGFDQPAARASGRVVVLLAAVATVVTIARCWAWFAGTA